MQIQGGSDIELQSEMNVTPLVDVVLVLLIIFMVVVALLMEGYNVDIPKTSAEVASAQTAEAQVILGIGAAGWRMLESLSGDGLPAGCRVVLAGSEIPAADLPARVAEILGGRPKEERVLFVAVDDRLNYEGVLRIVDLAKSQVEDLTIEVITAE